MRSTPSQYSAKSQSPIDARHKLPLGCTVSVGHCLCAPSHTYAQHQTLDSVILTVLTYFDNVARAKGRTTHGAALPHSVDRTRVTHAVALFFGITSIRCLATHLSERTKTIDYVADQFEIGVHRRTAPLLPGVRVHVFLPLVSDTHLSTVHGFLSLQSSSVC